MKREFYRIKTRHGTTLGAVPETGLVGSSSLEAKDHKAGTALVDIIVLDLHRADGIVFFCSDSDVSLNFALSSLRGRVVPMRLKPQPDATVAFQDPTTHRYLTACIPEGPNAFGRAEGNRDQVGGWEVFHLEKIDLAHHAFITGLSSHLARLFNPIPDGESVFGYLQQDLNPVSAVALDAVFPFFTPKMWSSLAKKCLNSPVIDALKNACKDDPWAAQALPDLVKWLNTRHQNSGKIAPSKRQTSPAHHSRFADVGLDGHPYSFAHALNYAFRRLVPPSRGACILACVRNEGIYLLEWIAYHRAIGFEWFFLYSNNNEDGSEEMLSALSEAGIITWIDNVVEAKTAAQHKAYSHALSMSPDILDFSWVQVVDGDEFVALNPEHFSNINSFSKWIEYFKTDAVAVNWRFMASAPLHGGLQDLHIPLTKRNRNLLRLDVSGEGWRLIKSFFKPAYALNSGAHHPVASNNHQLTYRLTNGDLHLWRSPPSGMSHSPGFSDYGVFNSICIYHYFYKSAEEWIWKSSRNRGDNPMTSTFNFDAFQDPWIGNFMSQVDNFADREEPWLKWKQKEFDQELSYLHTLPKVEAAKAYIHHRFSERYKSVISKLRENNIRERLNETNQKFFDFVDIF